MAQSTRFAGRRCIPVVAGLLLAFVLAACSSTTSPTLNASIGAGATPSTNPGPSTIPTPSPMPSPRPSGVAFCAVTPDASPSATIAITKDSVGIFHFGDPVTIKAGQAVAFTNGPGEAHSITEGTNGQAISGACVDEFIGHDATVIVTFYQLGTYQITCNPHPTMQTSVVVQ